MFCCSAVSICPCFSLYALAGVAVHSTLLAATAQRAAQEGFWAGGVSQQRVAQIFREGGARVSTNVMLRDLDIAPPHRNNLRRLEVGAEGLTLFGVCQLAIDATVSTLLGRHSKERTYPELCQRDGRARLVVVAGEGRWSHETKALLWSLVCAKAASLPRRLYGSARAAWFRRWSCLLACTFS